MAFEEVNTNIIKFQLLRIFLKEQKYQDTLRNKGLTLFFQDFKFHRIWLPIASSAFIPNPKTMVIQNANILGFALRVSKYRLFSTKQF